MKWQSGIWLFVLFAAMQFTAEAAQDVIEPDPDMKVLAMSNDARFLLGIGAGIVRFDVNAKLIDKQDGSSRFVDLEGNLGLDRESDVTTFYGSYRFSPKHSFHFAYFDIDRSSTFPEFTGNYEDLIVVRASVEVKDETRFYNFSYGYRLFVDEKSKITLVAGLTGLDLRFSAEATGEITVDGNIRSEAVLAEANVLAPLPLLGLNFVTAYTQEWSLATRVSLMAGSYQDVSASILQVNINSLYQFNQHVGLLLGLTYFSADVDINESLELLEVSYNYEGFFIGMHFSL